MNTYADKTLADKSRAVANRFQKQQSSGESTHQFADNRPEAIAQRKLQEIANNSHQVRQAAQLQAMANIHTIQREPFDENGRDLGASSNFWDAAKAVDGAFFGFRYGNIGPLASGPRTDLRDHIDTLPTQTGFTTIVKEVNQSLGVNTQAVLPPAKLDEYKRLTTELSEGKITDSQAMAQSSKGWIKAGNYPAAFLNAFGAIGFAMKEGVEADIRRKTGKE